MPVAYNWALGVGGNCSLLITEACLFIYLVIVELELFWDDDSEMKPENVFAHMLMDAVVGYSAPTSCWLLMAFMVFDVSYLKNLVILLEVDYED